MRFPEKPLESFPHGYSLAATPFAKLLASFAPLLERVLLQPWCKHIAIERPIFIIGAFRSGTTLLEQIIAKHPNVGHFWFLTNACSQFPVTGYWVMRLAQSLGILDRESKAFIHNPRLTFSLFSPYECEWIWSHSTKSLWDEQCTDLTVDSSFSDPHFEHYLFDLIRRHLLVQRATRFMNKNPVNCLRMGYLHKLFPDARFIVIARDPLDTILSHYRTAARVERVVHSDAKITRIFEEILHMSLLSMRIKTSNYTQTLEINQVHPILSIANQWKDLQAAALDSLSSEPGLASQALSLRYEELISQPTQTLHKLWGFIDLQDEHAQAITRAYAPRIAAPPSIDPSAEERRWLSQAQDIVAPVAMQLGYTMHDA